MCFSGFEQRDWQWASAGVLLSAFVKKHACLAAVRRWGPVMAKMWRSSRAKAMVVQR
ncbi:hypothetical protein EJ03DRAFT_322798 [Teratosphaeria nubilosa]|uniref:Uncharacterized protein n=1 Tax=Teratosphaeria nubilosa TaxID=161662 RepID=A0A6G1LN22_9PEZI|nr:hypothetical protein EJ03DRAFT_322798 [Teratosphaeria nubilosa]